MFSREDLQSAFRAIAEEKGLSLFDIDFPTVGTPTLRVYVWRAPEAGGRDRALQGSLKGQAKNHNAENGQDIPERRGITLDECADVARAITSWLDQSNIEGSDSWLLEVSSPGINRRLRLKEHFESAIGERIKLKLLRPIPDVSDDLEGAGHLGRAAKKESLVGELLDVRQEGLMLRVFDAALKKGRKAKRSPSAAMPVKEIIVPLNAIEEARVDFVF